MVFDYRASRALRGFAFAAALLLATHASAQTTPPTAQIDATPKGTIGLGLIGAELGFVIPTVCGLHETWSLIVFPTVGAAGGALGGYFGLDRPNHPQVAVGALVLGMALVIPSIVLTVSHTRYSNDDIEPSNNSNGTTPSSTTSSTTSRREERARRMQLAGAGALRWSEGQLLLSVPGFSVGYSMTPVEQQRYGGVAVPEFRLALFSGSF